MCGGSCRDYADSTSACVIGVENCGVFPSTQVVAYCPLVAELLVFTQARNVD